MNTSDKLNTLNEQNINILIEKLTNEKYIQDIIDNFHKELSKYNDQRKLINVLKIKKDEYIKMYISQTKFPEKLEKEYLNYKALLFYFLETFTYSNMTLSEDMYINNISKIQLSLKSNFQKIFTENKPIKINVNLLNFPHLIGYKDYYIDNGEKYDFKSTKNEFLKNILYESNLTNDYSIDGCDTSKIEAFSWIAKTLHKPLYIFEKEALKISKLKTDLVFVRKKGIDYHYVSLKKHINSLENEYYINSHHHIHHNEFINKFNINKIIYIYKF